MFLEVCHFSHYYCVHNPRYDASMLQIYIDRYDKTVYRNILNLLKMAAMSRYKCLRSWFLIYYWNIIDNRGEHCLRQFQYWSAYNDELRFTVKHQMIMAIFVYTSEWSANYLLAALHRHSNVGRKCFITASSIWGTLFLSFQMGW